MMNDGPLGFGQILILIIGCAFSVWMVPQIADALSNGGVTTTVTPAGTVIKNLSARSPGDAIPILVGWIVGVMILYSLYIQARASARHRRDARRSAARSSPGGSVPTRGAAGQLAMLAFVAFNGYMALKVWGIIDRLETVTLGERNALVVGLTKNLAGNLISIELGRWAIGFVILGGLVLATRPR